MQKVFVNEHPKLRFPDNLFEELLETEELLKYLLYINSCGMRLMPEMSQSDKYFGSHKTCYCWRGEKAPRVMYVPLLVRV